MLQTPVEQMRGVGETRRKQLEKLGITTVGDMLKHVPRAYRDLTRLAGIDEMMEGQEWFGLLTVTSAPKVQYIRRGFSVVRCKAEDGTGSIALLFYNQPFMKNNLVEGEKYYLFGVPSVKNGELRMVNPMTEREDVGEGERLLPVYRATSGLTQRMIRKLMRACVDEYGAYIDDGLSRSMRERHGLMPARDAYEMVHFPPDFENKERAVRSLAIEELLLLREYLGHARANASASGTIETTDGQLDRFLQAYPFEPTGAQRRVIGEIRRDIAQHVPMRRLLQGDVGSGKTLLAFYLLYSAAQASGQGALLAPTEILAEQHYANAQRILEPLGVHVGLLKAGMKKADRDAVAAAAESGEYDVVIGTHSLLSDKVVFQNLLAVVADEQHRFGVRQRAVLSAKGEAPHMLIMSATPIPRTLAMIVYGDLDISVLDELPPGRRPVETRIVGPHKRKDMYGFVGREVAAGHQAYVVCPIIEQDDPERKSVQQVHQEIAHMLPGVQAGLLHGRMKQADKDAAIAAFMQGEMDVLVSTTVIEVGVDVPNATIMIIEDADRFGLAQLHQLRGRVGRGQAQSWCFLNARTAENERLQALCASHDGFAIAQADLDIRGPGELLGTLQHGRSSQWIARLLHDARTLELVSRLYEELEQPGHTDELAYVMQKATERYAALTEEIAMN